jgi:hypothetical protein
MRGPMRISIEAIQSEHGKNDQERGPSPPPVTQVENMQYIRKI